MNKIQEEHHNEENSISDFSKDHLDITLKHMKGFLLWVGKRYYHTSNDGWVKLLNEHQYTTEEVLEEYIKTL